MIDEGLHFGIISREISIEIVRDRMAPLESITPIKEIVRYCPCAVPIHQIQSATAEQIVLQMNFRGRAMAGKIELPPFHDIVCEPVYLVSTPSSNDEDGVMNY